jgi:hypothetical protein
MNFSMHHLLAAAFILASGATAGCGSNDEPAAQPRPVDSGPPDTGASSQCGYQSAAHSPQQTADIMQEISLAPASIGADVPATYFGPSPSSVNPNLVGPLTLLNSGVIDFAKATITLPLYKGTVQSTGRPIYYILTDTSDKGIADELGLNFSAKLRFANAGPAASTDASSPAPTLPARQAVTTAADLSLLFDNGTVNFGPERMVTAGAAPNYFPPATYQPGSVGDAAYTPIVYVRDQGVVYNAPVVAYGVTEEELSYCDGKPDYSKVHDKVFAICPRDGTVTLRLTSGFSFGKPVLYLSTDASDPLPASIEEATFAPALQNIHVGGDDSAFSPVERIFSMANGPTNTGDGKVVTPQRQGLNSALKGEGSPLNVLGGIPHVALDYSPLWDFNLGVWTDAAIAKGYRSRLNEEFQILGMVQRGFLTGPGGKAFGSTGLIVNCPIVHRFL